MATEYMGPELMKEVMRFHARQANADLLAEQALEAADPAVSICCGSCAKDNSVERSVGEVKCLVMLFNNRAG